MKCPFMKKTLKYNNSYSYDEKTETTFCDCYGKECMAAIITKYSDGSSAVTGCRLMERG